MLRKSLKLTVKDTVATVLENSFKGDTIQVEGETITLNEDVEFAHKVLLKRTKKDAAIIKYGEEIGKAKEDLEPGTWIHGHNMYCNRGTQKEGMEQ